MAVRLIYYIYLPKSSQKVHRGVLIERAHFYTIRTIREGVLIEEGALTEVVGYVYSTRLYNKAFLFEGSRKLW